MSAATEHRLAVGDRAYRWLAQGASPVPVRDNGSKAPIGIWKQYIEKQPTEAEMGAMFGRPGQAHRATGFGLVLRGGIECLETEDADTELRFVAACAEAGISELLDRVTHGYSDRGPSGGVHRLYRVAGSEHDGNTKLAERREFSPKEAEKLREVAKAKGERGETPTLLESQGYDQRGHNQTATLIETRGLGGFIICAPSGGPTLHSGKGARYADHDAHEQGRVLVAPVPAGQAYADIAGSPETIAVITHAEREALCDAARTLNEMPKVAPAAVGNKAASTRASGAMTPGDWFNENETWDEVMALLGFRFAGYGPGGEKHWLRPGDTSSEKSATTDYQGNGYCTVFSTAVEWAGDPKPGKAAPSYSKFSAIGLGLHGGDFVAAARWVYDNYDVPEHVGGRRDPMPGFLPADGPHATPDEVCRFLEQHTRYTRPDVLGRRTAWMRIDGVNRRHIDALIREATRGQYPAHRALRALRQVYGQPPGSDPDGADRLFASALRTFLDRKVVAA